MPAGRAARNALGRTKTDSQNYLKNKNESKLMKTFHLKIPYKIQMDFKHSGEN